MTSLSLLSLALAASSSVDVTLTPSLQDVPPGCPVEFDVVLSAAMPTSISAVDLILEWDPAELSFVQAVPGPQDWLVATFLNDPDSINDDVMDGDALFTALVNPANPLELDPDATVVTFVFEVITASSVELAPTLGVFGKTQVVGTEPAAILTGTISPPVTVLANHIPAMEVVRLGTPPNPNAFLPGLTGPPVIGQPWNPVVDHTTFFPTALLDVMALTILPASPDLPGPFGTVLCNLFGPIRYFFRLPGVPFNLNVPFDCSILGVTVCTQAFSLDDMDNLLLTNALDITVGSI